MQKSKIEWCDYVANPVKGVCQINVRTVMQKECIKDLNGIQRRDGIYESNRTVRKLRLIE